MRKFAVSFISLFDNKLQLKIVEANTWREALETSGFLTVEDLPLEIEMEKAQEAALDMEFQFEIVEI
jgi:hypothetical protein